MQFQGIMSDWHGEGCLSSSFPTMNYGKLVLVLGNPSDPHRGPVGTDEVAHLCIVEATKAERSALARAGYKIPNR